MYLCIYTHAELGATECVLGMVGGWLHTEPQQSLLEEHFLQWSDTIETHIELFGPLSVGRVGGGGDAAPGGLGKLVGGVVRLFVV